MENKFNDIEDALAAQIIAQTKAINENEHKGDALAYAEDFDDTGGYMLEDIAQNVVKLQIGDKHGDKVLQRKAAINILNYTLFYMLNRDLL